MEYYDVELEERESHKIKQRREQIANSKRAGKPRGTPRHTASSDDQSAPSSPHSSERSSPVRCTSQQPYNPTPILQKKIF
ncbi:hypothetical protein EON65_13570 [archaeon]|nr:MAG: hypothetical protein EON65_13570 [archaeon]